MTVTYQEICPLCQRIAEYEFLDREKKQHFYCETCKEFVLADIAKRKLLKESDKCLGYSQLSASLDEDKFLYIYFDSDTREVSYKIEGKSALHRM